MAFFFNSFQFNNDVQHPSHTIFGLISFASIYTKINDINMKSSIVIFSISILYRHVYVHTSSINSSEISWDGMGPPLLIGLKMDLNFTFLLDSGSNRQILQRSKFSLCKCICLFMFLSIDKLWIRSWPMPPNHNTEAEIY